MKWGVWYAMAAVAALTVGCAELVNPVAKDRALSDPDLQVDAKNPNSRVFSGILHGFRPTTSVMLVTTGKEVPPNQVACKYDAKTRFYLDGRPMTLDEVRQYMQVTIKGYVAGEYFYIEVAKFSSVLPPNVRPAPETAPSGN